MTYPTYTTIDLSNFSGRTVASYPTPFSDMALVQAQLLFKMGTCLADLPDDPDKQLLAKMAMLSMADAIILAQPYSAAVASPFNSESIGSYSYSKTAAAVSSGLPTGISWFDLAVQNMSVCGFSGETGLSLGGGIEVFERQGDFVNGDPGNRSNNIHYLGPDDIRLSRQYGFDPAPNSTYGG